MKLYFFLSVGAASLMLLAPGATRAEAPVTGFIYETPHEFITTEDLDGDGRLDLLIVDKESGKFRVGYQLGTGMYNWVDNRPSGTKGISGFGLGKLLSSNHTAMAFASSDGNQITFVEAASPTESSK